LIGVSAKKFSLCAAMSERIEAAATVLNNMLAHLPLPTEDDSPGRLNAWQNVYAILLGATEAITKSHPDFVDIFSGDDPDCDSIQVDPDTTREDENGQQYASDNQEQPEQEGEAEESTAEQTKVHGRVPPHCQSLTPVQRRKRAQQQWRITRRAQAILASANKLPVTAEELCELIAVPTKTTSEKGEDMALSRIMRGFANAGAEKHWVGGHFVSAQLLTTNSCA
jgi:hypothetical protein